MASNDARIRARLEAWREQGADRVDPVRFGLIDALERRAHRYHGAVRLRLQERLAVLVDGYANALEQPGKADPVATDGPGPLRALLDTIGPSPKPLDAAATRGGYDPGGAPASAMPQLPALDEFRQLWGRIRTDSQLRDALAAIPEGAGPLHASTLLHRAMALMQEASPGYLEHFVAYVDALTSMERLQGGCVPGAHNPARRRNGRGSTRPRPFQRGD